LPPNWILGQPIAIGGAWEPGHSISISDQSALIPANFTTLAHFLVSSAISLAKYIQALGPSLVALAVAVIAYRQWATARDKLRLDLFEKRFSIYVLLLAAMAAALSQSPDREEIFSRLVELRGENRFIFGTDVSKLIAEAIDEIAHLISSHDAIKKLGEDEYPEENKKVDRTTRENIQTRLFDRQKEVFDVFKPYMSFELIRK
jgi:hypothetical protein